jgi:Fe2+ or Zn2+ uptake regulation protein
VRVFDPRRATENYRLVYEALEELGEASGMEVAEWVSRRRGRPMQYKEVLRRLGRLAEAGVVEKVRLVGAGSPRVVWRLKKGGDRQATAATQET